MNNFDYENMTPFKWFVLENFPFIENDFEAINNYRLFSKVVEYLNKTIDNMNLTGEQMENVTNAMTDLQNYVNNYFENLDVQDEINNKLDEMVEDGTLQEIITAYLNIKGILAFNTVLDMKNATNIVDGSFVKTYGKLTYNDGKGEFYKIRELTNEDVIDGINIIAINTNNQLVAELIKNQDIINIKNKIIEIENNIYDIKNRHIICIGDSYLTGSTAGQQYATDGWADYIINDYNLSESYQFGDGGSGFTVAGHNGNTFKSLITNNLNQITDKEKITDVICCGGYNDRSANVDVLNNAISDFINTCKNNFPNAKIYIGCISDNNEISSNGKTIRRAIFNRSYYCYHKCIEYGAFYLNGVENSLSINNLLSSDHYHPTPNGYQKLAHDIVQSWITGNVIINSNNLLEGININEIIIGDIDYSNTTLEIGEQIINNNILLSLHGRINLNNNVQLPTTQPVKIAHINFNAIKKVATQSWYFNESVKLGNGSLPTNSVWYINEDNDLYVVFYELPQGISEANKFVFTRSVHTLPIELI